MRLLPFRIKSSRGTNDTVQLELAYTISQRKLPSSDPYAQRNPGTPDYMERFVPGFINQLSRESKVTSAILGADVKAYDESIHRIEVAQDVENAVSWALVVDGLLSHAAQIASEAAAKALIEAGEKATEAAAKKAAVAAGRRAAAKSLAVEALKIAAGIGATTLAAKGAEAAGVNQNVVNVGTRLALVFIQIRAVAGSGRLKAEPRRK